MAEHSHHHSSSHHHSGHHHHHGSHHHRHHHHSRRSGDTHRYIERSTDTGNYFFSEENFEAIPHRNMLSEEDKEILNGESAGAEINKKTGRKKHKGLKTIVAVLLIVTIIGGAFYGISDFFLGKINTIRDSEIIYADESFDTENQFSSNNIIDPNDIIWGNIVPLFDDDLLNVLLVGQDRREDEDKETRQRSDTMILVSVNIETGKISMISYLRDLYVQIPGYSDNRLNAAYVFGGFPLMKSTFLQNFGINIDGCFEVDFEGFIDVIDAIGGVDIELTEAEARIIGEGAKAGECHLTGEQALSYSRIRKLDNDFGRTNRQKNVVMSAFSSLKDSSVKDLLALVNTLLPLVTTDLTKTEIRSMIIKLAPLVVDFEINTYTIPAAGTYDNASIRGMSVLVPNLSSIRGLMEEEYLPF